MSREIWKISSNVLSGVCLATSQSITFYLRKIMLIHAHDRTLMLLICHINCRLTSLPVCCPSTVLCLLFNQHISARPLLGLPPFAQYTHKHIYETYVITTKLLHLPVEQCSILTFMKYHVILPITRPLCSLMQGFL